MKKVSSLILGLLLCASAAQAKFTYWGYSDKTISSQYGSATSGKAAIYIPAEVAKLYVGKTVTGVRVGLAASASTMSVFVATDLNTPIATKAASTVTSGLNAVVKFDTPYTITGEGFYVGYEYSGANRSLGCSSVMNTSGNANWTDLGSGWTNNGTSAKALNIYARIEGDELPLDLSLVDVKDVAVKENTPFKVTGKLLNQGASKIYSYRLGYAIDGGEEQYADFEETVGERSETSFAISADGVSGKGRHSLRVRLVSADGEADVYDGNNTADVSVLATDINVVKRAYMEEMTGLMCGWCPRGIASIDACLEAYPDNFVVVAKHNYYTGTPEELKSPTYDYDADGNTTWPFCTIDRIYAFDPIPSEAMNYVQACIDRGTAVALDAKAYFVPGDDSRINANATAQFTVSNDNSNYRFAFALVEDGVTGYQQNNNYAGGSQGSMGGFESKPSMTSVTLNHVARMGYSVKDGIEHSIPTSVNEFSPISYDATLDIPSNVRNKHNLKVIAIVLNKMNGTVENAVQVPVADEPESGVAEIGATPSPDVAIVGGKAVAEGYDGTLEVYTADGKRVANSQLQRGVYIVRGVGGRHSFVKKVSL